MKQIKPFPKPSKMKKKHSKKCLSFCSSTFFPSAWNSHCFCDGRLKHHWIKTTKAYNLFLSPASDSPPPPPAGGWECGDMFCTHHAAQAMLLHQPEGVLIARGEVIGLCRAHVTSGHWAHSVDHICQKGTNTHTEFISPLTFLGKAKLHSWQYFSQCSWTILIFMTL